GKLPPIVEEVTLESHLLKRVVGSVEQTAVQTIKPNETLMLIVGSSATVGQVKKIGSKNRILFELRKPVAVIPNQRVAISRQIEMRWRLIGWGTVVAK
ncbi:MAG: translation initiation factor IF-2 subunit gamma, partial [Candidatus Hermodarchaeia archaeon]